MKKAIVIVAVFIVSIGLGAGVVAIYSKQTTIKNQQAAMSAQSARVDAAIAAQKQKQQTDTLTARITALQAECGKGLNAYNQLTVAQKKVTPAPVCS